MFERLPEEWPLVQEMGLAIDHANITCWRHRRSGIPLDCFLMFREAYGNEWTSFVLHASEVEWKRSEEPFVNRVCDL
eukprot:11928388-Karenia_brevis.AAC.1